MISPTDSRPLISRPKDRVIITRAKFGLLRCGVQPILISTPEVLHCPLIYQGIMGASKADDVQMSANGGPIEQSAHHAERMHPSEVEHRFTQRPFSRVIVRALG